MNINDNNFNSISKQLYLVTDSVFMERKVREYKVY